MIQEQQLDGFPAVAVLFARSDSIYKTIPGADVYDQERDATRYQGNLPVICHPPCRAWAGLRYFARPVEGEKELALFAVDQVRTKGGILEHPARSTLWPAAGLPLPGKGYDQFGGWTLGIRQRDFGHEARKDTWLYIVGILPSELPVTPLLLGEAPKVVSGMGRKKPGRHIKKGDIRWKPEISKADRERTPVDLATWLLRVAVLVTPPLSLMGDTKSC